MAFYKALEKVELKKYSEVSSESFGVVFYSKGSFNKSKLFDKEIKKKVSNFFEDEKKITLLLSKEFSQLDSDFLFIRDFDSKKPDYKIESWLTGIFNNIDAMGVEEVNVFADTSVLYKNSNFLFNLAKYAELSLIHI